MNCGQTLALLQPCFNVVSTHKVSVVPNTGVSSCPVSSIHPYSYCFITSCDFRKWKSTLLHADYAIQLELNKLLAWHSAFRMRHLDHWSNRYTDYKRVCSPLYTYATRKCWGRYSTHTCEILCNFKHLHLIHLSLIQISCKFRIINTVLQFSQTVVYEIAAGKYWVVFLYTNTQY